VYPLDEIVQKGGPTLARTYQNLTGNNDNPFPAFSKLLNKKFPIGGQANWSNDDPFPI
jgi:hypothetical protein